MLKYQQYLLICIKKAIVIMKAKNLNNSSKKTCALIKKVFAEMFAEKKELGKITVSELVKRADINRGTFYAHYDDIYSVAEDYENELIDQFFDNAKLLNSTNYEQFIDSFFTYIKENDNNYKMLCKSNELLFVAKKLTTIASNKFLEIFSNDPRIHNRRFIELEINIFIEGILCEYVKYCRGYSSSTPDDLYIYTKQWCSDFVNRRCAHEN